MPRFSVASDVTACAGRGRLARYGAHVVEREPRLAPRLAEAESQMRQQPPADVTAVRTMQRAWSRPTKTRPSSEALLRRLAQGRSAAAHQLARGRLQLVLAGFQLPYGLYDAAHVEGDIELRPGLEGRVVSRVSARTT